MRSAVVIYNPLAGRRKAGRFLDPLLQRLEASGFEARAVATAGPGDATVIARRVAAEGVEAAFALGGDGTIREVACGLLGTAVCLGILPAGSTNVLARALAIPREPLAAATAAKTWRALELDVGLCDGEPFLMMASSGLDSRVLRRQGSSLKRILGRTGIFFLGVAEWWRYSYPMIRGTADGQDFAAPFVAVCNIPLYGGPFRLVPGARCDDGCLDLLLFHGSGRSATLGFARDLALGRHLTRRDVTCRQAQNIHLELPAEPGLQVDGDTLRLSREDVEISLSPEKIHLLAPAGARGVY